MARNQAHWTCSEVCTVSYPICKVGTLVVFIHVADFLQFTFLNVLRFTFMLTVNNRNNVFLLHEIVKKTLLRRQLGAILFSFMS